MRSGTGPLCRSDRSAPEMELSPETLLKSRVYCEGESPNDSKTSPDTVEISAEVPTAPFKDRSPETEEAFRRRTCSISMRISPLVVESSKNSVHAVPEISPEVLESASVEAVMLPPRMSPDTEERETVSAAFQSSFHVMSPDCVPIVISLPEAPFGI